MGRLMTKGRRDAAQFEMWTFSDTIHHAQAINKAEQRRKKNLVSSDTK